MNREEDKQVKLVVCNACGRRLKIVNGLLLEDAFEVKKDWGYFSKRDLERHQFTLCEQCYETIIKGFAIPPMIGEVEEVL